MPESDATDQPRPTFISSLARESDRGFVLVGAARLDELLEKLLRAKLLACAPSKEKDLDFLLTKPLAPLGSFSIRILMARALGLISESARQTLEALREVRNVCAHVENWRAEKIATKMKGASGKLFSCPKADYEGRNERLKQGLAEFKSRILREWPEFSDARIAMMFVIVYMVGVLSKARERIEDDDQSSQSS